MIMIFSGCNDRIQKLKLLTCGAVQCFQSLIHRCGMDIGYPSCQFFFSFFCFGVIHDQIDRRHFSDNGHLPGVLPFKFLDNLMSNPVKLGHIENSFVKCLQQMKNDLL